MALPGSPVGHQTWRSVAPSGADGYLVPRDVALMERMIFHCGSSFEPGLSITSTLRSERRAKRESRKIPLEHC